MHQGISWYSSFTKIAAKYIKRKKEMQQYSLIEIYQVGNLQGNFCCLINSL